MPINIGGKPVTYRDAKSLIKLLDQINAAFPHRGKASDGLIGDKAHQAEGKASDHNPWVIDDHGIGVVRALDITHDPKHGCDTYALADRLRQARDSRVTYIISDRRITGTNHRNADGTWRWDHYDGDDPHTGHMHVSVSTTQRLYDGTASWAGVAAAKWLLPPYPGKVLRAVPMSTGAPVSLWQTAAHLLGYSIAIDGKYGPASEKVCRALQAKLHLTVDGEVGPNTWAATRTAVAKL